MTSNKISEDYFGWLLKSVAIPNAVSYRKLLRYLHSVTFEYSKACDANRASDGCDLRWRYAYVTDQANIFERIIKKALDGPCTMLEMMIALAFRCEETIMDDPRYGNRAPQWFWGMVKSMGFAAMDDTRFDSAAADEILKRFEREKYAPDGSGGLFTVRNFQGDLKTLDIWTQMCAYLDSIS